MISMLIRREAPSPILFKRQRAAVEELFDLLVDLGRADVVNDPDFSSGRADQSPRRLGRDWHHLHHCLAFARNDHFFSMLGQFNQLGETGLNVMDIDFHVGKISETGSS